MTMNEPTMQKSSLLILEALYRLYQTNLDNKDALEDISMIAWELCFTLHIEPDSAFHYLSELAEGTKTYGPSQAEGGHYVEKIEKTIAEMKQVTALDENSPSL